MSTEEKHLITQRAHLVVMLADVEKRLKEVKKIEQKPERKGKRGPSEATKARVMARAAKAFTPRS